MKKVSLLTTKQGVGGVAKTLSALTLLVGGCVFSSTIWSATPTELNQIKRIHERLTGVPPAEADLTTMAGLYDANQNFDEIAAWVVNSSSRRSEFYTTRLKNFFVQYTNLEDNPLPALNDAAATMIGMVRDGRPFDQVLYADVLYIPSAGYSRTSNANYENLDRSHADLSDPGVLVASTQSQNNPVLAINGTPEVAGVATTRAWGEAYYSAGTNRRVFRGITMNFMCRDLEDFKDVTRSPARIRQDVSRSPGGDSSIFLSSCLGCHAGMDPLTGAFAYYEWDTDHLTYSNRIIHDPDNDVKHKFLINAGSFPEGYITRDNSWENFWREGKNTEVGWGLGPLSAPRSSNGQPPQVNPVAGTGITASGSGPVSFGEEIAATKAFAVCQVERVYQEVCKHEPLSSHSTAIKALQSEFMNGYDMKNVFIKTAAMCRGN